MSSKNGTLESWHCIGWITGASCYNEIDLELSPSPPNCSKNYIYQLAKFDESVVIQKVYSKMHPVSYIY